MRGSRSKRYCTGVVVEQTDGEVVDLSACTCEPFFVMNHQHRNTSCPIDKHAQKARQETWEFDDNGTPYAATTDTTADES